MGADKEALGVVAIKEALAMAEELELDLARAPRRARCDSLSQPTVQVMITPDTDPPVCRIIDYSKYRYEQGQKSKEAKKKMAAARQEQKELKMRCVASTERLLPPIWLRALASPATTSGRRTTRFACGQRSAS